MFSTSQGRRFLIVSAVFGVFCVGLFVYLIAQEQAQTKEAATIRELIDINRGFLEESKVRTSTNRPIFVETQRDVNELLERIKRIEDKLGVKD
jgi:hypothetical protein